MYKLNKLKYSFLLKRVSKVQTEYIQGTCFYSVLAEIPVLRTGIVCKVFSKVMHMLSTRLWHLEKGVVKSGVPFRHLYTISHERKNLANSSLAY